MRAASATSMTPADLQRVHTFGEAVAVARFLGQQEQDGREQEVTRRSDLEPRVPALLHADCRAIVFDHAAPRSHQSDPSYSPS